MINQIEIQEKFEELLASKFFQLQPVNKWKQTMWHIDGEIIVSLVHLSKKSKFCFFNNPGLNLDKVQRWSSTIYSNNLEINEANEVNWESISDLIENTICAQ